MLEVNYSELKSANLYEFIAQTNVYAIELVNDDAMC